MPDELHDHLREHLAFTGTLQRSDGMVLLVRGASRTAWGHPFFGSPRPAEPLPAAVRRCAERDLGIQFMNVEPLLPLLSSSLSTRGAEAADAHSETHPSYVIRSDEPPVTAPDVETWWATPEELGERARRKPDEFDPVFVTHASLLPFFGGDPQAFGATSRLQDRDSA